MDSGESCNITTELDLQLTNEPMSTVDKSEIDHAHANDFDLKERELLRKYQMAVICSQFMEEFSPNKAFSFSQKEVATKIYDLLEENHYLSLKLKHAEKVLLESTDVLEQKWINDVQPPMKNQCQSVSAPHELQYWYHQMKKYEEMYLKAIQECSLTNKERLIVNGQLFFDAKWEQNDSQEQLTFYTQNSIDQLRITITNDTQGLTVNSSLYMTKLQKMVEDCLWHKRSAYMLAKKIWELFSSSSESK